MGKFGNAKPVNEHEPRQRHQRHHGRAHRLERRAMDVDPVDLVGFDERDCQATAAAVISPNSRSRSAALRTFESAMPGT